jgi:hypothetical protein
MSLLDSVVKGKIQTPDLIVIYGVDGVGKSTFAAQAPDVIFVGSEKGTANLDVARFPGVTSLNDVLLAVKTLTEETHAYKTLAIDSLDWLEPLVWDTVCRDSGAPNIEQAYGGYGKGYVAANKLWMDLMARLTVLRESKKMNIVLIAHAQVKAFNDPQQNATYDRYQLKLNEKASALFREYVDCVLFANFEVYTKQNDKKRTIAMGDGTRLIYTERRPGYDAKNRLGLPSQLPLDWAAYTQAKQTGSPEKPEVVAANLKELVAQVPDASLRTKIEESITKAAGDSAKLMVIQNKLRTLLSQ